MSNVRGPTSALTEFLRERGITARNANRFRRREEQEEQDAARSPSAQGAPSPSPSPAVATPQRRRITRNRSSMNFDEDDETDEEEAPEVAAASNVASDEAGPSRPAKSAAVKRAASGKGKAPAKKSRRSGKKASDDESDEDDDDYRPTFTGHDDVGLPKATSARANHSYANRTPGSIAYCSSCKMKFTITQYTKTGDKGPLCHKCGPLHGKSNGTAAPMAKPQPKPKRQARKKNMFDVTQKATPTLQSYCIDIISKHIENVEALGNIGFRNLDAISKSISKNRSLNPVTVQLFLTPEMTTLSLYDCSKLDSQSLQSIATFAPNLEHINLQLCGMLDNAVMDVWAAKLTKLKSLELYGPFLVRKEAWHRFLEAVGPRLESFKIRESPRFDLSCAEAMVQHCTNIRELGLAQIGPLDKHMLQVLQSYGDQLTYLDVSDPGVSAPGVPPKSLEDEEVINLLNAVGKNLKHLDLSKNVDLSDKVIHEGLEPCCKHLQTLRLIGCEKFETAAVAQMFHTWTNESVKGLKALHLDRMPKLDDDVVAPLLNHSGQELMELSLNSVDAITEKGLDVLSRAKGLPQLESLDLSFVRAVEDDTLSQICNNLPELKKVFVFGCNRISDFMRSDKVRIIGKEKYAA